MKFGAKIGAEIVAKFSEIAENWWYRDKNTRLATKLATFGRLKLIVLGSHRGSIIEANGSAILIGQIYQIVVT